MKYMRPDRSSPRCFEESERNDACHPRSSCRPVLMCYVPLPRLDRRRNMMRELGVEGGAGYLTV